ncbi:uncharacterized protein LOC122500551 [Leptopilina heterotoma]|uniref:uncharacterized protein LOC122500551 n=1 Tax=Leptopilina heterotoma TaxID=63436 RepID=UPI001CA9F63D|nr:uncharacterized protein LOC122500551 [Leptopilina heterotoma]
MCLKLQELGCPRIPNNCFKHDSYLFVDHAAGLNAGLVNGDYLKFEFPSKKKEKIVNLNVCLRGFRGMHLSELSSQRTKQKSWKFCFYQAITALLAKTQLRYKYAWSGNVDYIYDHAWILFIHTGSINVKKRQRLNDVVINNYKYNIELELVDELNSIADSSTPFNYLKSFTRKQLNRNELMHIPETLGLKKASNLKKFANRNSTHKLMEEWLDAIDLLSHMNCILKTGEFSLAFWREGYFWYLYNPYRCNEYGFFDDCGYNCIMKFCSMDSLKRYLIVLLSTVQIIHNDDLKNNKMGGTNQTEIKNEDSKSANTFTIQLFKMNFYCCKVHNVPKVHNKKLCPSLVDKFQLLAHDRKINNEDCDFEFNDSCIDDEGKSEETLHPSEIKQENNIKKKKLNENFLWKQYQVEEEDTLFSMHTNISNEIFPQQNQEKYFYACYVICAGMTRLISPEFWTPQTLNAILFFGRIYYTSNNQEEKLNHETIETLNTATINQLTEEFKIANFAFQLKIFPASHGHLHNKYTKCLKTAVEKCFLKHNFAILTCKNSCLGFFKDYASYYIFDVRSKNSGKGTACLLRTTYFHKFMKNLLLLIDSVQQTKPCKKAISASEAAYSNQSVYKITAILAGNNVKPSIHQVSLLDLGITFKTLGYF